MKLLLDLREDALGAELASRSDWRQLAHELHAFPDGESLLRIGADIRGAQLAVLADLARPEQRTLRVLLAAGALRAQGAASVGLIAPYLPYMRQDRAFHSGEAVTARLFAELLSGNFDWLLTVEAHLHRFASLAELFTIPACNLSAAPLFAQWVRAHVEAPLLVGPDAESARWVGATSDELGCPAIVLGKERRGDADVLVHGEMAPQWRGCTPVLLDDMISTGRTLIESCRLLRAAGLPAPVVLAAHGIFSGSACADLLAAGAREVLTTDSIANPAGRLSLAPPIAAALAGFPATQRARA